MAEAEFEARELARLLADANRQLEQFGRVTAQTQQEIVDAQMKAKYGINNYTAVTRSAGEALGAVASAGISAGKAMLEGKKGASALNGSLDDLAKAATIAGTALTLLMPGGIIIKGVVAAFTAVTAATIGAVKAANEMSDKLYKGYSGLAKSGGAAADGMTGVFNNAKKLGLSMNELDGFVSLINENSTDLAQFSGSVAAGRKRLADMGDALRGNRQGFLAMGLSMQDVSEGMANYMRVQARTGNVQERSARDSAAAAKEYIYQQDALAKITGISVKEQQKQREAALTEQMFLAQVRKLEREGKFKEAKELQDLNILMNSMGDETGRAYRASVTGRLTDEAARKGLMSTNGEMQRSIEMVKNGQLSAAQAANRVGHAMGEVNARQGDQLALLGVSEQTHLKYSETVKGAAMSTQDYEKQLREAERQREGQIAGADAITGKQAELMNRQINTNEKMERALFSLIPAAQDVMLTMQDGADKLADAFKRIIEAIDELLDMFGFGKSKEAKAKEKKTDEAQAAYKKSMEGTGFLDKVGIGLGIKERTEAQQQAYEEYRRREADYNMQRAQDRRARRERTGRAQEVDAVSTAMQEIPMAAKGGLLSGPESGYLAMLHGTEMVVPISGMGRKIEELGAAGLASGMDTMNAQVTAMGMGKDTAKKYNDIFKSMQASLQQPADEGKVEANKINALVKEISVDLGNQARTYERDAKNIKNFSDFQETYQRKMTDYMKEVLELCEDHKPEDVIGTAGAAAPGTAGAAGGGGIMGRVMQAFASIMGTNAPAAGAPAGTGNAVGSSTPSQPATAMPAASAPQGPEPHGAPVAAGGAADAKPKLTRVTSKSGKSTAVNAEFAPRFQGIIDYLDNIGYNIYSLGGYVDRDVRGQPGVKSVHAHGGAIDINPAENPFGSKLITDMPPEIGQVAAKLGLGWGGNWTSIKDAMHFSVAKHEGGTVKLSDGGVLTGPDSGYRPNIEMHGTEAVIPLKNGAVPVTLDGTMSLGSEAMALFQQMANQSAGMMAMMEEMVRAQRNSVDVQQKMLRNANS